MNLELIKKITYKLYGTYLQTQVCDGLLFAIERK